MTRSTAHSTISQDSANRQVGNRAVGAGRTLFLTFLTVVAVILGYSSYAYLHFEENLVAETQFKSIADRALDTSLEITRRKRLGTISMASILCLRSEKAIPLKAYRIEHEMPVSPLHSRQAQKRRHAQNLPNRQCPKRCSTQQLRAQKQQPVSSRLL